MSQFVVFHGAPRSVLSLGELRPRDPRAVCQQVSGITGVSSDALHAHGAFAFSRDRMHDPHVYVSTTRHAAQEYASIGSEMLDDALSAAYQILHPDQRIGRREWKADLIAKHDLGGVVLALGFTSRELLDACPRLRETVSTGERTVDEILRIDQTLLLVAPIPARHIVGVL